MTEILRLDKGLRKELHFASKIWEPLQIFLIKFSLIKCMERYLKNLERMLAFLKISLCNVE